MHITPPQKNVPIIFPLSCRLVPQTKQMAHSGIATSFAWSGAYRVLMWKRHTDNTGVTHQCASSSYQLRSLIGWVMAKKPSCVEQNITCQPASKIILWKCQAGPLLLLNFYAFVYFGQEKTLLRSHQYLEVLSDLTLNRKPLTHPSLVESNRLFIWDIENGTSQ